MSSTLTIHPIDDSLTELLEAMDKAGVDITRNSQAEITVEGLTASKILKIHGYEVTENKLHGALHQLAKNYQ